MGWFRVYFDVGWSSVVVRAESREEAVKEVWKALEEWSRGAIEGLRLGSYMVCEERTLNLNDPSQRSFKLLALVYAPESQRSRQAETSQYQSRSS